MDSWLGRFGTQHDDDEAFCRGEHMGGVRCPYFFSLGWQVTRVSPYGRGPFPSKEIRRISERDDPGPPVVPGGLTGLGSVWDPEPSKERVGDWGGPERSGPSCVLPKGVPQSQTESGGILLAAICWATSAPRKRRCTYRPSVIYLIVNKLLSLSLSLSLPSVTSRL
jgi:hypothetical protein